MSNNIEALVKLMRETADAGEYASPAEIRTLIAALEHSHKQCKEWSALSKRNIDERVKDISALNAAQTRVAELEALCVKPTDAMRGVAPLCVKLPDGEQRDDLVMSITEEIAHLNRCVERYRNEEMASMTQEMEQRLLVQQITLSVLNNAAGGE